MSARFPARQLTKAAIRDQLLVNIIPIVTKTCSVIGVKCNWSVKGGLNGTRSAWQERNECDQAFKEILRVAFCFSSISTFTRKRKEDEPDNVSENESNHEDGNEESLISSQASQVPQSAIGSPVNPFPIIRKLSLCDVDVSATRVCKKKEDERFQMLSQTVKDHKNPLMLTLVKESYKQLWEQLCFEVDIDEDLPVDMCDQVTRLVINAEEFKKLKKSIVSLQRVGLVFDVFTVGEDSQLTMETRQLGDPLTVLCNDIEIVLKKLNYAYRQGDVYKKVPESSLTYSKLCSMDSFLNTLLSHSDFKDRLLNICQD